MKWSMRALALSLAFGVSALVPGCSEDNEKAAGIKGEAPAGGSASYSDAMAKMKGGAGGMQGYPGAKRQEGAKKK
jgi:hypothetical protein